MINAAIDEWKSAQPFARLTFSLVLIVSFISVLFGIFCYPVIGHDAYVHLNWLDQFPSLFEQGILYPRWLPDSFGGFGSPTFYFYAPLVYWIAGLIYLVGIHSPSALYQIVQLGFSIVSVFTCYFLLRQINGSQLRSILGALVYSFISYRFCDVYVRDALTEHAALAFLPIIFLRFPDRLRSIAIFGLGWSGLFLTNLPIAYIGVISVTFVLFAQRNFKEMPLQALSLVIAIAASAAYLFPAFALRGLVHQRHLFDLPMRASQFGFALLDLFQGHFDWLRILSVATIIAGIICIFLFRKSSSVATRPWLWLIAVAVFLQIPFISLPIWHLFPGMPFVQFSWRWNGVLLLAISAIFVKGESKAINCIFIGLALITLLSELTLSRNIFSHPPLPINAYRMDAPEYAPKWTSNDPNEVIGITERRMSDAPAVLLGFNMPGDSVAIISKSPTEWIFKVQLAREASIRFHQFYWPYWRLHRDTTEITLAPDPNGLASTLLPAGQYSIALRLEKSEIETVSSTVSLIGLALLTIVIACAGYRWITKGRVVHPVQVATRKV
jgi:hypothetical protein